ncbi:hypothetical protein C2845_PM02G14600 [Panicum miliaceum]|uniref:Uncharacterized protein n=1 Tax=Panicum miliaceum TaxID=4540 RepID=A0A3L6S355_PANMI|nr:hypothetical protein C2845_PM02G14600 [Panicum miliaceum]
MVSNPALRLPPRTGNPPILNNTWEEMPSKDDMVQVSVVLAKPTRLKADKLTAATVALLFSKWLIQPIQDKVHLGYEYSGRDDPTQVRNRKVSQREALSRVACIVSGQVCDKGCPKAYCLKRPTTGERVVEFWCPAPLPEGQHGKAIDPSAGLVQSAEEALNFFSDSSRGRLPELAP